MARKKTKSKAYAISTVKGKNNGEPLSQTAYVMCKQFLLSDADIKKSNEKGKAVFELKQVGDKFVMYVKY